MSIMTVPADFYRQQLQATYDRYRRAGMEPAAALQRAQELMDNAFLCEDGVLQAETDTLEAESYVYG
jgi:hypothetical protein